MAYLTYNGSHALDSDLAKLMQRLDHLEDANTALTRDNAMLCRSVVALEQHLEHLTQQVNDTASKLKVMRDSHLLPSSVRAFDNFDILEHILLLLAPRQLFPLQSLSRAFHHTIDASSRLRSRMFTNAGDALLRPVPGPQTHAVWTHLALNPLLPGPWTRTSLAAHVALDLSPTRGPAGGGGEIRARYLVDTDLTATFECRIVSPEQSRHALGELASSLGRTYPTRPAAPATVWVAFLVPALIRDPNERARALRAPASVPPNVSAVVGVVPATLLEMYEVAEVMRRYFPRGGAGGGDPAGAAWEPFASPLAERDDLLHRASGLMRSTPEYGGWRTAQCRAHSLSDITDWL